MIPWGMVTIDAQGVILDIESRPGVDSHYGVEFYSGVLMPGMVNAHTHLELSHLRGAIPTGCGFTGFAEGLGAVRNSFTAAEQLAAADYHDARMYAEGVAATGDISNGNLAFSVKKRSKILYHTFLELYGLHLNDAERLHTLLDKARADNLPATITPHSAYSLNEAAFAAATGGAENNPLSIHFMESREEEELYLGRGDMHSWYVRRGFETDFTGRYDSPADRIIARVPPARRIMLVHNTHVGERDVQKLQAHFGGNLTWVLCPRSNLHIGGQMPPVDILRRHACRIAVGTDSLASNASLSIIEELKTFCGIPLLETLGWATLAGAQALGIDRTHGSLEKGKKPGIVLLQGLDPERLELTARASTRRLA